MNIALTIFIVSFVLVFILRIPIAVGMLMFFFCNFLWAHDTSLAVLIVFDRHLKGIGAQIRTVQFVLGQTF